MTPNPNSSEFIKNEVPKSAPDSFKEFARNLTRLQADAAAGIWPKVNPDNFSVEYNTYTESVSIVFRFTDDNQDEHMLRVDLHTIMQHGTPVADKCRWTYFHDMWKSDKGASVINSFPEYYMLELWKIGFDAELGSLSEDLTFKTDSNCVYEQMSQCVSTLLSSLKPLSWYTEYYEGWRFSRIYETLKHLVEEIRQEAADGRWEDVKPENFYFIRDEGQAFLVLCFTDSSNYSMTFKLGSDEGIMNTFEEAIACVYEFKCFSSDNQIKRYYEEEQERLYNNMSTILHAISYKSLFVFDENQKRFEVLMDSSWAVRKYCLMLDVCIPLKNVHEAESQLITKGMLTQKETLENILGTKMDIVEPTEPDYTFTHGLYVDPDDALEVQSSDDCPF